MTEEEERAIERLNKFKKYSDCHNCKEKCNDCYIEYEDSMSIETVLNLIDQLVGQIKDVEQENYVQKCVIEKLRENIEEFYNAYEINWKAQCVYISRDVFKETIGADKEFSILLVNKLPSERTVDGL